METQGRATLIEACLANQSQLTKSAFPFRAPKGSALGGTGVLRSPLMPILQKEAGSTIFNSQTLEPVKVPDIQLVKDMNEPCRQLFTNEADMSTGCCKHGHSSYEAREHFRNWRYHQPSCIRRDDRVLSLQHNKEGKGS